MDCGEARQMMDNLLDGDLEERSRYALERHIADCEVCARQYEETRAVEQWARGLKPASPTADFTERVMARVAADEPIYETSNAWLGFIAAFVIGAAVIPMSLSISETVYDWGIAVVASMGGTFTAIAADLAQAGNAVRANVAVLWSSVERWQSPLSPAWMMVTAATAFLFVVLFNFVQARRAAQRM